MSTMHKDGEASGERTGRPEPEPSSQRFQNLYRADLRPFEPVSDVQILAAIRRAEVHRRHDHASRSDIAGHLGFAHNSWTTWRLRPQLDALRSAGLVCDVRRHGRDLFALTADGWRAAGAEGAKRERAGAPRVPPASRVAPLTRDGERADRRVPRRAWRISDRNQNSPRHGPGFVGFLA
jgi:hypothetical protein